MKGRDTDMKRLIVAISGATGVQMGARLLEVLHYMPQVETHLVISRGAEVIFQQETSIDLEDLKKLADYTYDVDNLAAAISSGSYRTDGMIILPCSMKTLSGLANAYDEDLIVRAADVCLKENRRVVVVPREMPLNRIHCRNLLTACEAGYVIIPPMLTFYSDYPTAQDQVDHIIGKILMQFDLDYERFQPWKG